MGIQVKIPTQLRELTGGEKELQVSGIETLRELIEKISAEHPSLKERIVDEAGEIRKFVNIFVGEEDARFVGGLDAKVEDGTTVSILPAVAGGSTSA